MTLTIYFYDGKKNKIRVSEVEADDIIDQVFEKGMKYETTVDNKSQEIFYPPWSISKITLEE